MAGKRNRLMIFRDLVADRVFRVGSSSSPLIDANVDTGALAMKGSSLQVTQSPFGAQAGIHVLEEEVTLSGATTNSTIQIPNSAIVFNCSCRVTELIAGATSFSLGEAGNTTRFGGSIGIAAGTTNVGVIGPTAFYADTPMLFTAIGGAVNFSAGKVRIALSYYIATVPTS